MSLSLSQLSFKLSYRLIQKLKHSTSLDEAKKQAKLDQINAAYKTYIDQAETYELQAQMPEPKNDVPIAMLASIDGYLAHAEHRIVYRADSSPGTERRYDSSCRESFPLAEFLTDTGYRVSVINPAQIHAFGKSELNRAKTDKADAKLIARYGLQATLDVWIPLPRNIRDLQAMTRRIEHLLEMQQMERNRLDTADTTIIPSINAVLTTLDTELKATRKALQDHIDNDPDLKQRSDLLNSIPGIGPATIAHLLIALSAHHGYLSAKQVVAHSGLAP